MLPSDKRYSTTKNSNGLEFSLFDFATAQEVPFCIARYVQGIHSWTYQRPSLCSIHLLTTKSVDFVVAHNGNHPYFHGGYLDYRGALLTHTAVRVHKLKN